VFGQGETSGVLGSFCGNGANGILFLRELFILSRSLGIETRFSYIFCVLFFCAQGFIPVQNCCRVEFYAILCAKNGDRSSLSAVGLKLVRTLCFAVLYSPTAETKLHAAEVLFSLSLVYPCAVRLVISRQQRVFMLNHYHLFAHVVRIGSITRT
jgi:hypothetical protein